MKGLLDRLLVFFLSVMVLALYSGGFDIVAAVLAVFCLCCLATAFSYTWVRCALSGAYFVLALFYPPASFLLAPFAYCIADNKRRKELIMLLPIAALMFTVDIAFALCCLLITLSSLMMCYRLQGYEDKERELKVTRDTGVENSLVLAERNKRLIEQQDSEVRLATLKERNRIAREIHDNVGHTLSRSVLQLGAIMAVTKNDENVSSLLLPLRESLDSAMDNIRKSVHDLRDDSIDLKLSAQEIMRPLQDRYTVRQVYNISDEINTNIKLCFLAVLKEAVSNVIRHSDADTISVEMEEHPAFAKLVISDNGSDVNKGDGEGMGLSNMQERVRQLDGNINISRDGGFRIYITVPKNVQKGER
ncbi:MAG: two-component sensor histidine kinase [Ruminococcus sp.]|nr:two-component sensor histidine kinase [Ruminococcus sp.]